MAEMTDEEAEHARQEMLRFCRVMLTISIGIIVVWAVIDHRSFCSSLAYGYVYVTAIGLVMAPVAFCVERFQRKHRARKEPDRRSAATSDEIAP